MSLLTVAAALVLSGCGLWSSGDQAPGRPGDAGRAAPPAAADDDRSVPEGPNVLLVVWDTVRADRLTPYGHDLDTTPRLQAFAEEGRVYERAVSPGMWTLPSHASLFTGLPVSAHGAISTHKWLDERFVTVAEHFGDHGYDTYLFSANPYLGDHTNLGQGFATREFPWSKGWKRKSRQATMGKVLPRDASNVLGPRWKETTYPTGRSKDQVKDAGPVAAEALLHWVDARPNPERPWFAFLNYMEAHVPRIPSRSSREALFDAEMIGRQLALDQSYGFLLAYTVQLHEFTDEEVATIAATYDATLRDLDAAFGALVDQLEARGVLDDTIVVLTADHGEHLGEHHRIGHKYSVYNPLVRVPLIVRYPAAVTPGREPRVVSTLSTYATLAELAGLPVPDQVQAASLLHDAAFDGEAVSELVAATPQALERMRRVHPDFTGDAWAPWLRTYESVETDDAKCIRASDGERELYAMPDDALETTDLSAGAPERTDAVCGRLDAWRAGVPVYDPSLAAEDEGPDRGFDPAIKARLEALGYMEDDEGDE